MLGGVQIEHELAERAFEPCKLALQHREARAGEFRGALEIHQAERLADLEMLLRLEVDAARLADLAHLDIVVLVLADRHVVERHVGDHRQRVVERLVETTLLGLGALDEALDLADLGLQPLGQRHVLVAHRIADLLRGGVAAFLCLLQVDEMLAARLVPGDQVIDGGARLVLRPLALHQRIDKRLRFVANPFDVEHGRIPIILGEAAQRASCPSRSALASPSGNRPTSCG